MTTAAATTIFTTGAIYLGSLAHYFVAEILRVLKEFVKVVIVGCVWVRRNHSLGWGVLVSTFSWGYTTYIDWVALMP